MFFAVANINVLFISASKTTNSHYNLKILRHFSGFNDFGPSLLRTPDDPDHSWLHGIRRTPGCSCLADPGVDPHYQTLVNIVHYLLS